MPNIPTAFNDSKINAFHKDLNKRKAENKKGEEQRYFTFGEITSSLEKGFEGFSNADIVRFGIEQGYIHRGQSSKDVAHKIGELDKDMEKLLISVIDYNDKKKKGKGGKNFSLTGVIDRKLYKNPREYLEAIYGKLRKYKLGKYMRLPTLSDFDIKKEMADITKQASQNVIDVLSPGNWAYKGGEYNWDNPTDYRAAIRPLIPDFVDVDNPYNPAMNTEKNWWNQEQKESKETVSDEDIKKALEDYANSNNIDEPKWAEASLGKIKKFLEDLEKHNVFLKRNEKGNIILKGLYGSYKGKESETPLPNLIDIIFNPKFEWASKRSDSIWQPGKDLWSEDTTVRFLKEDLNKEDDDMNSESEEK